MIIFTDDKMSLFIDHTGALVNLLKAGEFIYLSDRYTGIFTYLLK